MRIAANAADPAGTNSGAAVSSALQVERCPENGFRPVAVIVPSPGERCLGSALYLHIVD